MRARHSRHGKGTSPPTLPLTVLLVGVLSAKELPEVRCVPNTILKDNCDLSKPSLALQLPGLPQLTYLDPLRLMGAPSAHCQLIFMLPLSLPLAHFYLRPS